MISSKINVNVRPSQGHFFEEADGTQIRGNTWIEVVKRVQSYRSRNHIAPGNAETEVLAQACQREPQICKRAHVPPETPSKSARRAPRQHIDPPPPSLKTRLLGWLRDMRKYKEKGSLVYVDLAERHRRAKICLGCPHRKAMKKTCGACNKAVDGLREEVLGERREISPPKEGCNVLGTDLPVMLWLDELTVENANLPANCWRKKTL